jgi:hypothetical protein
MRYRVLDVNPVHIRVAVYSARTEEATFILCGTLTFSTEEWVDFDMSLPFEVGRVRHEPGG